MKKIFSKIASLSVGLAMAVGVGVALGRNSFERAKANEIAAYVLDGTITGGSNGYATESDITQDEIAWKVTGNTTMNPWRIGGSSLTNVDRTAYSTDPINETITKVELSVGTASSITVNSLKLIVSSTDNFSTGKYDEVSKTFSANSTIVFQPSQNKEWSNKYYKFVFNVTVSSSSSKFVQFKSATFYKESSATIQSVSLINDGTAKTEYYDGDSVSLAGIKAIATMSEGDPIDVTTQCTITADRAKVATGETSITYSATMQGQTIPNYVLNITVAALEITSIAKEGNYRIEFTEKQKFTYGTGKVKVTYNSGATKSLNPLADGVTTKIGNEIIDGSSYYLKLSDNGKALTMHYNGFTASIGTLSVVSYTEHEVGYWSPITNVNEIEEDMEVIIVASDANYSMGKYSSGNNIAAIETQKDGEGKISSFIPGVQIYTVVESTEVPGTYCFFDGTNYLSATGGTNNNYLVGESEISSKTSFAVTITDNVMSIVGQGATGDSARMTMKYNSGSLIFSCYLTNSTGSLACLYKFTSQAKSADQIAVENFCKTSLHLDDTDPGYIDPNDNTQGTACKGNSGYYKLAKDAYELLTDDQKEIFATSADTLIAWGRARLSAWAEANSETFDPSLGTFSSVSLAMATPVDNSYLTLILVIFSATLVMTLGMVIVNRRKIR